MIESIDLSIADNKHRVENEVASYIENNQDAVATEIAEHGFVTIVTSVGIKITEEQLEGIAA